MGKLRCLACAGKVRSRLFEKGHSLALDFNFSINDFANSSLASVGATTNIELALSQATMEVPDKMKGPRFRVVLILDDVLRFVLPEVDEVGAVLGVPLTN